jgi:arylsulfatase A-like enzyme/Tfp pilus assembly protein PilF
MNWIECKRRPSPPRFLCYGKIPALDRMGSRKQNPPPPPSTSAGQNPERAKRWSALKLVLAALAVTASSLWFWAQGEEGLRRALGLAPQGPLNVILVTADTLRADKLGCYGNASVATPHLDRMADSGVLFENATTVTPLTLPAHSSIFTGTYPTHHGVRDNGGYYLDKEQVTLAEALNERGYATGAFVSAFVLDSRWGLDQGFDRYFDNFDFAKFERVSLDTVQRRGDETLGEAVKWMETARQGPFFSWIHLYDPHTPYDPPEPFRSPYSARPWGLYDGEVAYLDSLMGQLLDWLAARGLEENTLLAFIGDHGESLGQHREATHGFFIYDATTHVPFILKVPSRLSRKMKGRRVAAQVRVIDLMPTLLDLLGVKIPPAVQGVSLAPLARGERDDLGLVAYSESYYPRYHYGWSELKSLRNGSLHFVSAPRPELFDLRADRLQQKNLAVDRPGTVRQLEAELSEIVERYSVAGIDERGPASLDAETQERLAALGYIGGPTKIKVDASKPLADPKDKIALFNLIKAAGMDSSEGRVDEALGKIDQVLAQDADILEAHDVRGNLYRKKGDLTKAIAAYKEALQRDPGYKSALFNLALAYKDSGRTEDAALGFRRVLELDPRDNKAYYLLAEIHVGKKEFAQALSLLKQAVDVGSERAPLHNLMAECYFELKDSESAEREIKTALEMNPELRQAHFNLALIREERGDLPGAIAAYEKEISLTPKAYKAHFNLAKLFGKTGQLTKQIEHFEKAVELNESFANGYLYLAKAYLDAEKFEEAIRMARKGIELGPDRSLAPLGHFILVDVYNRLGRFRDAERELAIARRLQGA